MGWTSLKRSLALPVIRIASQIGMHGSRTGTTGTVESFSLPEAIS